MSKCHAYSHLYIILWCSIFIPFLTLSTENDSKKITNDNWLELCKHPEQVEDMVPFITKDEYLFQRLVQDLMEAKDSEVPFRHPCAMILLILRSIDIQQDGGTNFKRKYYDKIKGKQFVDISTALAKCLPIFGLVFLWGPSALTRCSDLTYMTLKEIWHALCLP